MQPPFPPLPADDSKREFRAQIWRHQVLQETICTVCDRAFEQQYVAVALYWRGEACGTLCPMCLGESPAKLVNTVRQRIKEGHHRLQGMDQACASMAAWQVTLDELEEAEAQAIRQRFPLLRTADIDRIVHARFREIRKRLGKRDDANL